MEHLITNIKVGLLAVSLGVASLLGYQQQPPVIEYPIREVVREVVTSQEPIVGASTQSSEARALFSTTLASKITSSATSMTLSSATDKDGNTLASSTYGFIIDEGTSVEEFVLADCTGTTCTNMTRGLSVSTGTTTVAALQFEHRRGASVKITTAPTLVFLNNVIRGKQNIEHVLKYNSIATSTIATDRNSLVSWGLLQDTAFTGSGAIEASETVKGYVEIATAIETASSTNSGSAGRLAIAASNATSTYNSATAALKVVVTKNDGKIDSNFLPSTVPSTSSTNTFTGINSFSTTTATTTNIGAFPAYHIGKNIRVITTTGFGSFTVPSGINKIYVRLCSGGGTGGTGGDDTSDGSGGGGGGGGCAEKMVDTTGTTTMAYSVGAAGAETYLNTGAGVISCTGGSAGSNGDGGSAGLGGSPGSCTGGDLNFTGQYGGSGKGSINGTANLYVPGGTGGACVYGSGGRGGAGPDSAGTASAGFCGGGGGGVGDSGGAGSPGFLAIIW